MKERHLELSNMFNEMGKALIDEGSKDDDYIVSDVGSTLVAIGGLILDHENLDLFYRMSSLLASKMILDSMGTTNAEFLDYLKAKEDKKENESYEDYLKRINEKRKDNGHEPIS